MIFIARSATGRTGIVHPDGMDIPPSLLIISTVFPPEPHILDPGSGVHAPAPVQTAPDDPCRCCAVAAAVPALRRRGIGKAPAAFDDLGALPDRQEPQRKHAAAPSHPGSHQKDSPILPKTSSVESAATSSCPDGTRYSVCLYSPAT